MPASPKPEAVSAFEQESMKTAAAYKGDKEFMDLTRDWMNASIAQRYSYNFTALGRPVIQYPADIVAMQEIVWAVKPDLIVETGIAHGGSLILSASMLALLDYCDAVAEGTVLDPKKPKRRVLGVDIDIRAHNKAAIEAHPLSGRIDMIQGSSVDPAIVARVHQAAAGYKKILVCLDSNHTHDHVLAELEAYAPLTTKGSYCIAFDTIVEDLPPEMYPDRPWKPGDNPKTAVRAYLRQGDKKDVHGQPLRFEVDRGVEDKLLLSVAPEGYLKRV